MKKKLFFIIILMTVLIVGLCSNVNASVLVTSSNLKESFVKAITSGNYGIEFPKVSISDSTIELPNNNIIEYTIGDKLKLSSEVAYTTDGTILTEDLINTFSTYIGVYMGIADLEGGSSSDAIYHIFNLLLEKCINYDYESALKNLENGDLNQYIENSLETNIEFNDTKYNSFNAEINYVKDENGNYKYVFDVTIDPNAEFDNIKDQEAVFEKNLEKLIEKLKPIFQDLENFDLSSIPFITDTSSLEALINNSNAANVIQGETATETQTQTTGAEESTQQTQTTTVLDQTQKSNKIPHTGLPKTDLVNVLIKVFLILGIVFTLYINKKNHR